MQKVKFAMGTGGCDTSSNQYINPMATVLVVFQIYPLSHLVYWENKIISLTQLFVDVTKSQFFSFPRMDA
jgi:hypothetical protein